MRPNLYFAAFEPLQEVPEVCDICDVNPPILRYEFDTVGQHGHPRKSKGCCCSACAGKLLGALQLDDRQNSVDEEGAVKSEDFDVSDFRQLRLAAVPKNWN